MPLAYMVGLAWFEFHAGASKGVFELSSWLPYSWDKKERVQPPQPRAYAKDIIGKHVSPADFSVDIRASAVGNASLLRAERHPNRNLITPEDSPWGA